MRKKQKKKEISFFEKWSKVIESMPLDREVSKMKDKELEITEKPIIFLAEMVRAILENRKSQTRRVIKPQPIEEKDCLIFPKRKMISKIEIEQIKYPYLIWQDICPYGKVGSKLWVRKTWMIQKIDEERVGDYKPDKWTSPLFMPRWAPRITLEITDIRVERLQEMPNEDLEKEGFWIDKNSINNFAPSVISAYEQFKNLWNSLAKEGFKWENNPWVWVIGFKRIK